jgi:hypothetical protein
VSYEAGDGRQQKKGKLRHGAAAPKEILVPKNELKNNQTEMWLLPIPQGRPAAHAALNYLSEHYCP